MARINNTTVPNMLMECADTYAQRNSLYGDTYKKFGPIMREVFPDPLFLQSDEDHNRFGILVQIVGKIARYASNFHSGGHDDSLLDIAVYATMLRELDNEYNEAKKHR